jgi:hypothetical protein
MSIVLVALVALVPRVLPSPSSQLRVSHSVQCIGTRLIFHQTPSKLVTSSVYSPSPSSRSILAFTRWLVTAAAEVAVVAGVAVVAEAAVEVVVVSYPAGILELDEC